MVLRLKPRESRTLPGLPRTEEPKETRQHNSESPGLRKQPGAFALRADGKAASILFEHIAETLPFAGLQP